MSNGVQFKAGFNDAFNESLANLSHAAERLSDLEGQLRIKIPTAGFNTVAIGVSCLGQSLSLPPCVTALVRQAGAFVELRELSDKYQAATAAYEQALQAHIRCLSEIPKQVE